MKTVAAILAAGRGRRMGAGVPKQYIDIDGRPLICYALGAFQAHPEIKHRLYKERGLIPPYEPDITRQYEFKDLTLFLYYDVFIK